jgi:hypothetical protein
MSMLVIEVWRGLVQTIYTDAMDIEIVVVDRDCQGEDALQCQTLIPASLNDLPEDLQEALPRRSEFVWKEEEKEGAER